MSPAGGRGEVCLIGAPLNLDVQRQADTIFCQVSIDLLLTTEDQCLGIEVHGFSHSKARSLSFLFSTLLAPSLNGSGNRFFFFRHLQNEDGGFRDRDQKQRRNEEPDSLMISSVVESPSLNFPPNLKAGAGISTMIT